MISQTQDLNTSEIKPMTTVNNDPESLDLTTTTTTKKIRVIRKKQDA